MKSPVVKRSIVLAGHKTSVSLEDAFWEGLKEIAKTRRKTLSDLVGSIDTDRKHGNLSSALRLFVLGLGRVKTKSDLVVMSSGRQIFAFFCSPHDRRAQNSGCDYTPQSFYTARTTKAHQDAGISIRC